MIVRSRRADILTPHPWRQYVIQVRVNDLFEAISDKYVIRNTEWHSEMFWESHHKEDKSYNN